MTGRLDAALAELVAALREELSSSTTTQPAPDRLYSMADAARHLGVSRTTLYAEARAGRVRTLKVGRRRLVPGAALGEFSARADSQ
jgi:excisionase family DNA binding protein